MIIKKTWQRTTAPRYAIGQIKRYHYTGWFLLGFLPLYVCRITLSN